MIEIKVSSHRKDDNYDVISYELVNDGVVVGYAMVIVDDQYAYLERIDIEESYRGQGLGTASINQLVKEYGSIVAAPDNEGSQRLFERLGVDVSDKYWMVDQGFGVYEL